ncbi:hypothetical protein, partial [uncultured Croceitalea sp.]|uniref:hypothetical protein n=1 Tax=uncultured Croceitalea sp. TaxID=1798908 RepID=UPI00374F0270
MNTISKRAISKKKNLFFIFFLFVSGVALSQTTVTLQDQCNCEVLSGTDVSASGATTPSGADLGDLYVNTNTGDIFYWDGDSWELTSDDNQQLTGFTFNDTTNQLTLDLENGGTVSVDLSSLSDTLSDTNTVITSYTIDTATNSLVITDSDSNTFSVSLTTIAAIVDTDDQTLSEVLAEGADAGGTVITNLGTPIVGTDAATKDYVDNQIAGAGDGDITSSDLTVGGDADALLGDVTL